MVLVAIDLALRALGQFFLAGWVALFIEHWDFLTVFFGVVIHHHPSARTRMGLRLESLRIARRHAEPALWRLLVVWEGLRWALREGHTSQQRGKQ
jgi:hypothetical protein